MGIAIQAPFTFHLGGGTRHGWHDSRAFFLLAAFVGGFGVRCGRFLPWVFVVSGHMAAHPYRPIQTTTLIVGYGLLTQGLWRLET